MKVRHWWTTLSILLALTVTAPSPAEAVVVPDVQFAISPCDQSVVVTEASGKLFTASVQIDTVTAVRSAELSLSFDPSLMQVESVGEETFLSDWAHSRGCSTVTLEPTIDNVNGLVSGAGSSIACGEPGGPSGHGVLLTYNLRARPGMSGDSPLAVSNVLLKDASGQLIDRVAVSDCRARVSWRLRLTSMCSPNPESYRVWAVRNPAPYSVVFTWAVVGTSQTGSGTVPAAVGNVNGEAFFNTVTVPGSPNTTVIRVNGVRHDVKASNPAVCPPHAPWDVNRDGVVDLIDLTLVGLRWMETGPPGWIPEDVNSDGIIDLLDAVLIGLHYGERVGS